MERPDSRLIRVFLSSTFVDFQEERSLLVQRVFPSLRRRARSREVEIVDVDLRWGVTAEQTEQGETLPLCLGEIDRCRPYFISLLGERYGWVPPPNYYKPELLERQPWLKERMGGASVTELEILHGVLRNPEMAGHAFFYLRDPAYAEAQSEPGWVAESPSERQRLEALKNQIRTSGFPVVEGLPDPQAIAERIEADLWQLIESQFPEQEPADALERETRKHAEFRRARTGEGQYIGGEASIQQLEQWISEEQQRILVTGESGSGKSALIANWLEAHQRSHPKDLVHAHHLGCTNDASAVRPLLGRLIDTASKLLLAEQQISEAIQVPQDWWELVFKVGEVFALLSPWCQRQGRRWILVLDGLDRLAEDDQQALPWIPTTIPPGIYVVASALDCPARTILQERQYRSHEIGPLGKAEQQQLIERYLSRYTKQLESGLQQRILAHPLAGSPLYLKVLLEELRQCAWFDTLTEQVEFYLSAVSIDGLYAKVLERLENNGHGEASRKALTALWASRAGLSEDELLAITGLTPLQWAPIDLALEQAFHRNGNRLVLDHNYLRRSAEIRYLSTRELRQEAHSAIAEWYGVQTSWTEIKAEELPWQLQRAGRTQDIRSLLLSVSDLYELAKKRTARELVNYWLAVKGEEDNELDELIAKGVEEIAEHLKGKPRDMILFAEHIAAILREAGHHRKLWLQLRKQTLQIEGESHGGDETLMLSSLACLATAYLEMGRLKEAGILYHRCLEAQERLLGTEHPDTISTVANLGTLYCEMGNYDLAENFYTRALTAQEILSGREHPSTLNTVGNLADLFRKQGDYVMAEAFARRCLEAQERLLGLEHPNTLDSVNTLGNYYLAIGDYVQAEIFYTRCLQTRERVIGPEHPSTLTTVNNLGLLYQDKGDYVQAETFYARCLEARERLLGPDHPDTLTTVNNLGCLYLTKGNYDQAEAFFTRCLQARERLLGLENPDTIASVGNLAALYFQKGDCKHAEAFYKRCLEAQERLFGPEHPSTLTTVNNLGLLYQDKGDYVQAETFYARCLEASERLLGPEHPTTLTTVNNLATLLQDKGDLAQALIFYTRCLMARERLLGPEHLDTINTVGQLGNLYWTKGNYELAEAYLTRCLEARVRLLGPEHPMTLVIINNLAVLFQTKGDYEQAEAFFNRCLEARERLLGPEHPSTLTTINKLAVLYQDKGDYEQAEALYKRCLEASERLLGPEHPDTLATVYNLAEVLSALNRQAEAIPLRRRELAWCQQQHGTSDPGTLYSLNQLAIDLTAVGELEESEALFRKLISVHQELLEPDDFDIGRALGGLAKTLEEACKLDEAADYARQCLEHRTVHEGPEAWWTNRARIELARILNKLGRDSEALLQIRDMESIVAEKHDIDYDDRLLLTEAMAISEEINAS